MEEKSSFVFYSLMHENPLKRHKQIKEWNCKGMNGSLQEESVSVCQLLLGARALKNLKQKLLSQGSNWFFEDAHKGSKLATMIPIKNGLKQFCFAMKTMQTSNALSKQPFSRLVVCRCPQKYKVRK